MPPLRILILSDGRPGHFNLSDGIAAALGRRRSTTVVRTEVRRGRWPGAILAAATRTALPAARMLHLVYGVDAATLPPADVLVSAGAETLAASAWLARARAIPNLHYGSLRHFRPTDFALTLTSYTRNAGRPRHLLALKPSALDPDRLAPGADGTTPGPGRPPERAALLIGGESGTFRYTDNDWSRLLGFLAEAHAACGVRWQVSNSRRTPQPVSDRVAAITRDPMSGVERFVDVRSAGSGTLREILAAADAVLCTDDSSSMISECVWARLPVLGITPAHFHHTPDEGEYRSWLAASGWCRTLPIAALTPAAVLSTLATVTPMQANPLDALADQLFGLLPQLLDRQTQDINRGRTPGA